MFVNVAAPQGELRATLISSSGEEIEGFGIEQCIPVEGDLTRLTAATVYEAVVLGDPFANEVMAGSGYEGVFNLVVGDGSTVGTLMNQDTRLPLISATGSCNMGRIVGPAVAQRMGRTILELGGNNAVIVMDDADLDLAVRATLFSAVGTAGQRCTSLRRLLVHRAIADKLVSRLTEAYRQVSIGDPLQAGTLMGPLAGEGAVQQMMTALDIDG